MARGSPGGETDAVMRLQGRESWTLSYQHRSLAHWYSQSSWEQGTEAEDTESTEIGAIGQLGQLKGPGQLGGLEWASCPEL